jgi:transposase
MRAVVEAVHALRGVEQITAVTMVAELGTLSRFRSPRQLMGYSGLVSREFSSAVASNGARSPKPGMPTSAG